MDFKPHTLYKQIASVKDYDEYGRLVANEPQWVEVCGCRADNQSVSELSDDKGAVVKSEWHIVCESKMNVAPHQRVRVTSGGDVLCEGIVTRVHKLNFLPYAEVWI